MGQGHTEAQYILGLQYCYGKGVPQDDVLAHMWFDLSTMQGHEEAQELRDSIAKRMSPADIDEAEKLAREWKPVE